MLTSSEKLTLRFVFKEAWEQYARARASKSGSIVIDVRSLFLLSVICSLVIG